MKPVSTVFLHGRQMEVYKAKSRFKVVVAGRRWGKALALDTPIPTPSGWTTMGDLKDDDLVFDERGNPCRVVHAHAIMNDRLCYEVEFSDGTTVIADGEHLWETWTHASRKNSRRNGAGGYGPAVVSTEEIARTLTFGKRGDTNHSVVCTLPVQYPVADLPIAPYILGMWLGDGDSRCAAVACSDSDLKHVVGQVFEALGLEPSSLTRDGRTGVWRVSLTSGHGCDTGVQKRLRALGLLENKHIPQSYLQASVEQRMALMHGLMDTDGTCNEQAGNCEFTSVRKPLAEGFLELALSLGIKATMIVGRSMLNGKDFGEKYRVKFSTDLPVFRMQRKLDRMPTERRFRIDHRFIKAVRPVASVPVRCITVDSPRSLYLCTKSFIPTHNTQLSKVSILKYAKVRNRLIWYVAPSYRMAKQIMWPELLACIPRRWVAKINETTLSIKLVNGTRIELKGADNPDSLRGVGIHFLVMDEVQDIDPEAWTKVLRPTLASTGGHALFIGCVRGSTRIMTRDGACSIESLSASRTPKTLDPINLDVYGMNRAFHKADGFWNNGIVKTKKISTHMGFRIEASEPHPIMVMGSDGVPVWKRSDSVEVGDRVAIGMGMEQWGNKDPLSGFDEHMDKWKTDFVGKRGPKPKELTQ